MPLLEEWQDHFQHRTVELSSSLISIHEMRQSQFQRWHKNDIGLETRHSAAFMYEGLLLTTFQLPTQSGRALPICSKPDRRMHLMESAAFENLLTFCGTIAKLQSNEARHIDNRGAEILGRRRGCLN